MATVPGYYLDSIDGTSDLFVCAACVERHGKDQSNPASADVLAWAPLGCGFHIYDGNPADYS